MGVDQPYTDTFVQHLIRADHAIINPSIETASGRTELLLVDAAVHSTQLQFLAGTGLRD